MANSETERPLDKADRSTFLAGERTDLAIFRTYLASKRTLMGWVRTGLSLISFGFTIYKVLKATIQVAEIPSIGVGGPRRLGLVLIGLGTSAVVLGAIDYVQTIVMLNKEGVKQHRVIDFTFVLGMAVGMLGLFLFLTIIMNREVF